MREACGSAAWKQRRDDKALENKIKEANRINHEKWKDRRCRLIGGSLLYDVYARPQVDQSTACTLTPGKYTHKTRGVVNVVSIVNYISFYNIEIETGKGCTMEVAFRKASDWKRLCG